jgi:hypothetical protein
MGRDRCCVDGRTRDCVGSQCRRHDDTEDRDGDHNQRETGATKGTKNCAGTESQCRHELPPHVARPLQGDVRHPPAASAPEKQIWVNISTTPAFRERRFLPRVWNAASVNRTYEGASIFIETARFPVMRRSRSNISDTTRQAPTSMTASESARTTAVSTVG